MDLGDAEMKPMKFFAACLLAGGLAFAQTPVSAEMTNADIIASAKPIIFEGPNGSEYLLLARHDLPDGYPVTSVMIRRADDSRIMMDIGFDCPANAYTYLAMNYGPHFDINEESLETLASQSRNIATTGLQALIFTPITDDPFDAPFAKLYDTVCPASEPDPAGIY